VSKKKNKPEKTKKKPFAVEVTLAPLNLVKKETTEVTLEKLKIAKKVKIEVPAKSKRKKKEE